MKKKTRKPKETTKKSDQKLFRVPDGEGSRILTEEELIAEINAICDEVDTSLDPVLRAHAARTLLNSEW